ncbi:Cardioacceleratory peptide receptor [Eumeta japonica]|uniref:Cardioacceleratory peptide receptor n=1 Tax=Eumeta variegata TaxID=151549 RepID=A0A4C1T7E3_EUMVA|nr:Cardioacceleratory peptide receptor [Eumeta japonica]
MIRANPHVEEDLFVGLIYVLSDIIQKITIAWLAGEFMCKLVKFLQVLLNYRRFDHFRAVCRRVLKFDVVTRTKSFELENLKKRKLAKKPFSFISNLLIPVGKGTELSPSIGNGVGRKLNSNKDRYCRRNVVNTRLSGIKTRSQHLAAPRGRTADLFVNEKAISEFVRHPYLLPLPTLQRGEINYFFILPPSTLAGHLRVFHILAVGGALLILDPGDGGRDRDEIKDGSGNGIMSGIGIKKGWRTESRTRPGLSGIKSGSRVENECGIKSVPGVGIENSTAIEIDIDRYQRKKILRPCWCSCGH